MTTCAVATIARRQGLAAALAVVLITAAGCSSGGGPATAPAPLADGEYDVARVIDGDTIDLTNGRRVRFIGVDTPEREQCFYDEATAFTARLLASGRVRLDVCEAEPEDKYGRVLAFLFAEGRHVNAELLEEGMARLFYISPCDDYEADFARFEEEARRDRRGLWGACEGAADRVVDASLLQ